MGETLFFSLLLKLVMLKMTLRGKPRKLRFLNFYMFIVYGDLGRRLCVNHDDLRALSKGFHL